MVRAALGRFSPNLHIRVARQKGVKMVVGVKAAEVCFLDLSKLS